jgi:hypothetical protein
MRRREFVTALGGGLILAGAVRRSFAQSQLRRVAWLGIGSGDKSSPYVDSLRIGLNEHGWVEGRNLSLSLYWARGRDDMEDVARALVATNPRSDLRNSRLRPDYYETRLSFDSTMDILKPGRSSRLL